MRVFFIPWGHVDFYAQIWAYVTSISHMGEILDSDWSRQKLLRSDWLPIIVASITTVMGLSPISGDFPFYEFSRLCLDFFLAHN